MYNISKVQNNVKNIKVVNIAVDINLVRIIQIASTKNLYLKNYSLVLSLKKYETFS